MPGRRLRPALPGRWGVLVLLAAVVLAVSIADAASKAWAVRQVLGGSTSDSGWVQVRHVTNAGAAFGLGHAQPLLVLVLALGATAAVAWWLSRARTVPERVALAVVLGGALGNVADRLADGVVVDWIKVAGYPATFNLADAAIRLGVLAAIVVRLALGGVQGRLRDPASDADGSESDRVRVPLVRRDHGAPAS